MFTNQDPSTRKIANPAIAIITASIHANIANIYSFIPNQEKQALLHSCRI